MILFGLFPEGPGGPPSQEDLKNHIHSAKFGLPKRCYLILVILCNFSSGQPKTHFLAHLVNYGHEGGSNVTQIREAINKITPSQMDV